MIYSQTCNVWCVRSTKHTNYLDVVEWCTEQWGQHAIENRQDGSWSYCDGEYYGIHSEILPGIYSEMYDQRLYFSFKSQEDAMFFSLRWGK